MYISGYVGPYELEALLEVANEEITPDEKMRRNEMCCAGCAPTTRSTTKKNLN